MFDFSDDGQRAALFGFQHQNENLVRDSFLGTFLLLLVFMLTENNAAYAYTGIQAFYNLGKLNITHLLHQDYMAKVMEKIWDI